MIRRLLWALWIALIALSWASLGARAADGSLVVPTDFTSLLSTFGFPTVAVAGLVFEFVVPRGRLADQKALTAEALAGWKTQTDATNRLAMAIEERNQITLEAQREAGGKR